MYYETNLEPNAAYEVIKPFVVKEIVGEKPSNSFVGSAQLLRPVYRDIELPVGAVIEVSKSHRLVFSLTMRWEQKPFVLKSDPKSAFEKRYAPDQHVFPLENLKEI